MSVRTRANVPNISNSPRSPAQDLCLSCGRHISLHENADDCTLMSKLRRSSEFSKLLSIAEQAVSAALSAAPVHGTTEETTAKAELIRETLSLARTLVSSAKIAHDGGMVSKSGFVQGKGSQIDTLCAELATLRRMGERP